MGPGVIVTPPSYAYERERLNAETIYPHVTLPVIRQTGANIACVVKPPVWTMDSSGVAAAGRYLEVGEVGFAAGRFWLPFDGLANYESRLSCFMDSESILGPGTAAFSGFQLGTPGAVWPYPAAPVMPCVQMRMEHAIQRVKLFICKGDGVTASTTIDVGDLLASVRYELRHKPGQHVELYIAGDLAYRYTGAALPNFSIKPDCRIALVQYTGTAANGVEGAYSAFDFQLLGAI